jgi:hypothetical protein
MAHWHRLGLAVGLTALVGCGNPTPDAPVSGHTTGSADAVVSPHAGGAASAGPAAQAPARQAPTQTSPLDPPAQQAPKPDALITDASRTTTTAHNTRVQTAAAPADRAAPDEQTTADQAQREARQQWLAELRAHPDATVRLQALDLWAQEPGDDIESVLDALGDEDEQVQARAEELWEQQLIQEEELGEQAEG